MKRYYVSVTETLNKIVSVDAESENEAVQKVQDALIIATLFLMQKITQETSSRLNQTRSSALTMMILTSTSTSQKRGFAHVLLTKTLRI